MSILPCKEYGHWEYQSGRHTMNNCSAPYEQKYGSTIPLFPVEPYCPRSWAEQLLTR